MTTNKLTILCVTLLSVFAVACGVGGVGGDPLDLIAPFDNDSAANGGPIDSNDGFSNITIRNDRVQAVRIYVQGVPRLRP